MIYMLSHSTWTDGIILRYATDEAGLKAIALGQSYIGRDVRVEIDWEETELRVFEDDDLVAMYYIFSVGKVEV
jgi:hypothetical protein